MSAVLTRKFPTNNILTLFVGKSIKVSALQPIIDRLLVFRWSMIKQRHRLSKLRPGSQIVHLNERLRTILGVWVTHPRTKISHAHQNEPHQKKRASQTKMRITDKNELRRSKWTPRIKMSLMAKAESLKNVIDIDLFHFWPHVFQLC